MNIFLAALLVATVAYIFSYFWYGRFAFKNLYEQYLERSNKAAPHPRPLIFILFYGFTFLAFSLVAYFVSHTRAADFWSGARIGFYISFIYIVLDFANALFHRLHLVVASINWGYWLLVLTLGGGFLAVLM